jgi:septation ring formation regulator EzrA
LHAELKQLQADRNKLLKDQEDTKKKCEQKCSELKIIERALQVIESEQDAIKNELNKISKG